MGDQHGDQVLIDSDVVQEFWVYTRKPTEMKKKNLQIFYLHSTKAKPEKNVYYPFFVCQ